MTDDLVIQDLAAGRVDVFPDQQAPTGFDGVRAVLWIPDPEQRHGWREYYVRDPVPQKPGSRLGF